MAALWERAANSVNYILSLYYVYLYFFFVSHSDFEGGTMVLIWSLFTFFSFVLLGLWKTEWAGNVLLKCHPW